MQRSLNANLMQYEVFIFTLSNSIQWMSFLVPQDSFVLAKGCTFTESIFPTGRIAGMGKGPLQYPLTEKGLTKLIAQAGLWQFLQNFQPHGTRQSI